MERSITLNFSHFVCQGYAQINMWGGGKGRMKMYAFRISEGYTEKDIKECLNDGGFGCESIDGAVVDLYAIYTDGVSEVRKFHETIQVGELLEEFMFDMEDF